MATIENQITHVNITGMPDLDPIDLYFEDFSAGAGRVTISCYGMAWTAYFGGMGKSTIREFVQGCGADYLAGKLIDQFHVHTKKHEKYLLRIVIAVKKALQERT